MHCTVLNYFTCEVKYCCYRLLYCILLIFHLVSTIVMSPAMTEPTRALSNVVGQLGNVGTGVVEVRAGRKTATKSNEVILT